MRAVFSVLSLLFVVAIVGFLAKKQMGSVAGPSAAPVQSSGVTVPSGTPQQQTQQVQKAIEAAMQQARPVEDGTK